MVIMKRLSWYFLDAFPDSSWLHHDFVSSYYATRQAACNCCSRQVSYNRILQWPSTSLNCAWQIAVRRSCGGTMASKSMLRTVTSIVYKEHKDAHHSNGSGPSDRMCRKLLDGFVYNFRLSVVPGKHTNWGEFLP